MTRALLVALALGGCARGDAPAPVPRPAVPAVGVVGLEPLPRQTLRAGECGLYLWAANPPSFVIAVTPGSARIARGGRQIDLAAIASDGDPVLGFSPRMEFGPAPRLSLDLAIEARSGLTGGAAVPSGAARITGRDGTEVSVAVAGLIGCQ